MGFECQLAAESRGGRAAANQKSCMAMIDRVERGCKKARGRFFQISSVWNSLEMWELQIRYGSLKEFSNNVFPFPVAFG